MKPRKRAELEQEPVRRQTGRKPAKKAKDSPKSATGAKGAAAPSGKTAVAVKEHIVEIVSDSGEGAQRCGQSFGAIAARTGHGIWTVEIIPAEIQPPARSVAGASGNRVRLASRRIMNGGDEADLVIAFNEQVLLSRVRANELKPGCVILLENKWRSDPEPEIAEAYTRVCDELTGAGYRLF